MKPAREQDGRCTIAQISRSSRCVDGLPGTKVSHSHAAGGF